MLLTPTEFVPGYRGPVEPARDALWFVIRDLHLLVTEGGAPTLPRGDMVAELAAREPAHFFGRLGAQECWALRVPGETPPPPGYCWASLRALFVVFPDALLALAGRALQILEWDRSHRYCGRCGTATVVKDNERVRLCPSCGYVAYPRISPAMMVLVRRGRELLLARAPHYAPGMYSALAGFVEAGESIEETVRREVREEVGLEVANLRYFASQSWPFPHQLMIAFHADYAGGELRPDPVELVDAAWFPPDRLPALPTPVSVARRLIEAAVAEIGIHHA
jgi:NAD+ diphosphatase